MRYMGDAISDALQNVSLDVTGAAKAQLIAQAALLPDDRAAVLVECADASSFGHKVMLQRYGIGAAIGAVVGAAAVYLLKKK